MSISIHVNDPANTPKKELALVIEFLQRFHDAQSAIKRSAPAVPIAPDDNPAAGMEIVTPEAAFGAAGNVPVAPSSAAAEAFGTVPAATPISTTVALGLVPPAPSAQPSGTPAAPPTGSPAASVELDKHGLPWDGRIHASSKAKNADQSWRGKRGVDEAVVTAVVAELRNLMAIPSGAQVPNVPTSPPIAPIAAAIIPPAPGGVPTPPAPSAAPGVPSVADFSQGGTVPPAPAPTPALIAPPAAVGASPTDFVSLVAKIGPMLAAGTLTQADVATACATVGLPNIQGLVSRPDLTAQVNSTLDALAAAKGM